LLSLDPDLDYMDDPATYETRKIEEMRKHGFPSVRVGHGNKKPTRRKPW